MRHRKSLSARIIALSGGLLAATAIHAQEAPTAAEDSALDEVVVSARNRTERAQDVPIPISVVGGAQLERDRVFTVADLTQRAPGLTATTPNAIYVGDITYLPLATGANLYLASVIDCYSRRVAGWAIAEHMRTELVEDALLAAYGLRGTLEGAIFHSDHGSQYTSRDFATLCTELGVIQSMGAVGTSADNSLAESFNAALKREVLQDNTSWPDAATCRREVFRWLARYNTTRRHSYCNHVSPANYERIHTPTTLPKAA